MDTSHEGRTTVSIVGCPAVVAMGLVVLISEAPDLEVGRPIPTLAEFQDHLLQRSAPPDVVMLHTAALTRPHDLKALVAEARIGAVIGLLPAASARQGTSLLEHGASACLPLESLALDVVASVRLVAQGARLWFGDRDVALPSPDIGLTHREAEIYELLLARKSNAEIAHDLSISVHTVSTHVKRILRKAGVSSRRDL